MKHSTYLKARCCLNCSSFRANLSSICLSLTLFFIAIFIGNASHAQSSACNLISNGSFSNSTTGWTLGTGWNLGTYLLDNVSTPNVMENADNGITNSALSQNVSGLPSSGPVTITLKLGARDANLSNVIHYDYTASLSIILGTTTLVTFDNNNTNSVISATPGPGVTINGTFSLSASHNTSSLTNYNTTLVSLTISNWTGGSTALFKASMTASNPGDDFTIDDIYVTGDCATIAGNVFNDVTNDGTVNGTGTNAGVLYANLLNAAGVVIATVPVNADGTYSLSAIAGSDYTVRLSTTAGTIGSAPPAQILPTGWTNVGDAIGSTQGATANGISETFTLPSGGITNVNFAIHQPPVATNDTGSGYPAGSSATINPLANDVAGSGNTLDPTSVSLVASSIPGASCTNSDAQGDCLSVTVPGQGVWVVNPVTGEVTFTPQAGYSGDPTPIGYTVKDYAGVSSNTATISLDYIQPTQPCEAVTNGSFATNTTGWTLGTGWTRNGSGFMENSSDGVTNSSLSQAVPNVSTDGSVVLSFSLASRNGNGNQANTGSISVVLGGVTYATFFNPNNSNTLTSTASNGAVISGGPVVSNNTTFPTFYTLTVTIPYTGTVSSPLLEFVMTASNPGDDFAIDNVSLEGACPNTTTSYTVTGTVYNDPNGSTGGVDGTGTNAGGLYVNLVNSTGQVVAVASVNTDGTYTFPTVTPGTGYTVQISTTPGTIGQPVPAQTLPSGWGNTGDEIGTTQGTTADGRSEPFSVSTNISEVNFGLSNTFLPIVFGKIDAIYSDGELIVNWTTLNENNVDHFDIEISKDGNNFNKIGTISSKATDGNSAQTIEYNFKSQRVQFSFVWGIGIIMLLSFLLVYRRRKATVASRVVVILLVGILIMFSPSCTKPMDQLAGKSGKIFIRIVEVDKSGIISYSKVIQARSE